MSFLFWVSYCYCASQSLQVEKKISI